MKTPLSSLTSLVLASAAYLLCATAPQAQAGSPVIITGGLTTDFDGLVEDDYVHYLSFQVIQDADGNVSGVVHNHSRRGSAIDYLCRVEIDAIHFLDENTVILTGIDVWDTDPEFIGTTAGFIVRDNGQGKGAFVDTTNGMYFGLNLGYDITIEGTIELIESGAYDFEADLFPVLSGNIQIIK